MMCCDGCKAEMDESLIEAYATDENALEADAHLCWWCSIQRPASAWGWWTPNGEASLKLRLMAWIAEMVWKLRRRLERA